MSRQRHELMEYANQQLMDELNEFMIDIKTQLFQIPINRHQTTIKEIDSITQRIMHELKKDATPFIRR